MSCGSAGNTSASWRQGNPEPFRGSLVRGCTMEQQPLSPLNQGQLIAGWPEIPYAWPFEPAPSRATSTSTGKYLLSGKYLGCIGRAGPLGNTSRLVALPGGPGQACVGRARSS